MAVMIEITITSHSPGSMFFIPAKKVNLSVYGKNHHPYIL